MQRIVHSSSCVTLVLALVLVGPGGSGPAKGAMLVEPRANGEVSRIWLDSNGNPVSPGGVHVKCQAFLMFSAPLPETPGVALTPAPLHPVTVLSLWHMPDPRPASLHPIPRASRAEGTDGWLSGHTRPEVRINLLQARPMLDSYQDRFRTWVTDLRARH